MRKYTIILPTYNSEKHIQECVHSVLSQTYPNFELIVLDSYSSDSTLAWLYSLKNEKIKIYPVQERIFIAENWARVQKVERSEFMTFIGHDDVLMPNYLTEMNLLIQKHPEATLYQTHFNFIDVNGKFLHACLPMDEVQQSHEFLASLMAKTLDSMATGYMFRTGDYDRVGGISTAYPDLLFADNELWIKLTSIGYKATSINTCFQYRLHQSLSRTTAGMHHYQSFTAYMKFLKTLTDNDKLINQVVSRYGKKMLYEYCESVAHRLLKTSIEKRSIKVKTFVAECREHAASLIPGQGFDPLSNKRIAIAQKIDDNRLLRTAFQKFRKSYSGKL